MTSRTRPDSGSPRAKLRDVNLRANAPRSNCAKLGGYFTTLETADAVLTLLAVV